MLVFQILWQPCIKYKIATHLDEKHADFLKSDGRVICKNIVIIM